MTKSIEDRIKASFDEDDKEETLKYMDWINSALLNYCQDVRRNAGFLLLLVAIFELVIGSRKATISIGSFGVSRNSIALTFLPAIVSFLYMQAILDSQKASRLNTIFSIAFKIWSPNASANKLDLYLSQPAPVYWNMAGGTYNQSKLDKLDDRESVMSYTFITAIIFGILAFEAQAYYLLFSTRAPEIIVWAVSLLVTLFCLVSGMLLIFTDFQTVKRDN
jgi:hypothetical protein